MHFDIEEHFRNSYSNENLQIFIALRLFLNQNFEDKRTDWEIDNSVPISIINCINTSIFCEQILAQLDPENNWTAYTGSATPNYNGHAFLLDKNGMIADLTGDQFGFPEIILKAFDKGDSYHYEIKNSVKSFGCFQHKSDTVQRWMGIWLKDSKYWLDQAKDIEFSEKPYKI